MIEQTIEVPTKDGMMNTFVIHPQEGGPFASIVLFMDIWGVREELREIARRIATVGYACLLPDFYHRQGNGIHTETYRPDGRMVSLHKMTGEQERKVYEPRAQLTGAMRMDDTAALLKFIDGHGAMRGGPVGSVGWCMGGWMVMAAAGNFPDRFQASASLHGTMPISDKPDSPHLLVDKFQGELYCGFGELDHLTPPAMAEELGNLLEPCAVKYRSLMHKGVEHGYQPVDEVCTGRMRRGLIL
ncbi:MAG: dienelactone hydrolase family protein [Proteobacteria bacterium]|nr:dienelactone hydrolase family protein [Pseudomonadota bacterium]